MLKSIEILRMAHALAAHASTRQGLSAANAANADTPGFRARDLPDFAEIYRGGNGDGMALRHTRDGHLSPALTGSARSVLAPGVEKPNGNTVSLEGEMMRAAAIRGEHDKALAVYKSTLSMIRSSLGRG